MKKEEKEKSKKDSIILIAAKAALYVIVAVLLFLWANILPRIVKPHGWVSGTFLNTVQLMMRIFASAIIAYGTRLFKAHKKNKK